MEKFSRYKYLKNHWHIITRCYNCYKEIVRKSKGCGHKALFCLINKSYLRLFEHYFKLSYHELESAGYFEFGQPNAEGNPSDVMDLLILVIALASKRLLVVQEILESFYLRLQSNQSAKHRTWSITSFPRSPPGKKHLLKTQVALRRVLVSDIL